MERPTLSDMLTSCAGNGRDGQSVASVDDVWFAMAAILKYAACRRGATALGTRRAWHVLSVGARG